MPQMAPINWLSLFIVFSVTFLIFNMMIYYSFISYMPKSNLMNQITMNSFNWKW